MSAGDPLDARHPDRPRGERIRLSEGDVVWRGKPSIGPLALLYGVVSFVAILALLAIEYWLTYVAHVLPPELSSPAFGIPYGLEVITVFVVLALYAVKLVRLAILRARHTYILRTDGMYFNRGIANLESTFVAPMAFSDARLIRTVGLRLVGLGEIIIESNDRRRFEMRLISHPVEVQSLIRRTLSRPTVRLEGSSGVP